MKNYDLVDYYRDVIKMLLEKGAVYDVKDGVSYAVYNVTKLVS